MTEFELIARIGQLFAGVPRNGFEKPGDDCTVLGIGGGESLLFTADLLTEGIHFLRNTTPPYELGRKALAVNLSDVAAMGGRSVATLLSVALPPDVSDEWTEAFLRGYRDLSAEEGVMLAGGDTTSSRHDITVNVTVVGRAADHCIKRRSDARAGDAIVVAGVLGASGAGLRDLLAGNLDTPNARIHNAPVAQTAEGLWLGERTEVHAMTDLSDGLASDLRHIAEQSHVGATVDLERIPIAPGSDLVTALTGGEDYKLLFTAAPEALPALCRAFESRFGRPLYPIGTVTEAEDDTIRLARVRTQRLSPYPQAEELLPSGKYSEKAENPLKRPIYSLSWEHNPLSYHGRFQAIPPRHAVGSMRMYADRPSDEPDAAGPDTGRFGAHRAGGRVARLGPQDRRFPDPSYPDARYGTPRRTRHHPPVTPGGRTQRGRTGRRADLFDEALPLGTQPYGGGDTADAARLRRSVLRSRLDPAPLLQRRGAETGHTLSAHNGSTAQTR